MRQPSRQQLLALALCSAVCLISAVPLPQPAGNQELDVLQIPLANGKEIDVLTLGAKDQEQLIADRNKRTIGLLRDLFPDITKEIDMIVNRIIAQVIRVAGPGVLNSILAGNRGGAAGAGGRSTTPASDFDADFDADFDEDDDVAPSSSSSAPATGVVRSSGSGSETSNEVEGSSRVKIDLPTFAPPAAAAAAAAAASKGDDSPLITTTTTQSAIQSSIPTSTSPSPSNPTTSSGGVGGLVDLVDPLVQLLPRSLEPVTVADTPPTSTTTTTTTTSTTTPATSTTTTSTTTTEPPPTEPTTTTTTTTTSNTIQFPTNNSIEEPQLLTIIADINRLLNSTNYFITTRDNITTTTTTTTVATTIDNNNITKLLPVFD
ncbi:hypothetical protein KR038_009897 [Drosophila bunnanda]|nr:hypothetical protein KR038_009897 [Drosophila bunnanda]